MSWGYSWRPLIDETLQSSEGITLFDDPITSAEKDASKFKPTESDDSLRKRLLYVAGDTGSNIQEISVARDKDLDDIAERYGLKRRA